MKRTKKESIVYSMTGFSSGHVSVAVTADRSFSFMIELKSLNSRFFEVTARLPGHLNFLETDIISILKQKLIRGRIFFTLTVAEMDAPYETIVPALQTVQSYITALQKIQKSFKIPGDYTIADIAQLPNVFVSQKATLPEKEQKKILAQVELVAESLMHQRMLEGKNLLVDLKERFAICLSNIKKIKNNAEKLMKQHKKTIEGVLESFQKGDEQAKMQLDDLYSTLNKIDINEEITRFNSHLAAAQEELASSSLEKGKRLEFMLQELLRETNTIAAKCSNFEISSAAVDIKVELEKLREQVQNIL